jgi:antitoxin ParD1/3/4
MSYFDIMPNVSLTPELESFAAHCVQTGRYANVSEVARAALRLLQQAEQQRQDFVAMLQAAEAEGEAIGFTTAEALGAELDAVILEAGRPR